MIVGNVSDDKAGLADTIDNILLHVLPAETHATYARHIAIALQDRSQTIYLGLLIEKRCCQKRIGAGIGVGSASQLLVEIGQHLP